LNQISEVSFQLRRESNRIGSANLAKATRISPPNDADPEIPILKQAKAEYAKLQ
jgi:hypothetical protein